MNSFFYSIELTYYSTYFLCEAIVNRSGFNVEFQRTVTMRMRMNMRVHQTMAAKINQINIFSTPLMPQHHSIILNNTIH